MFKNLLFPQNSLLKQTVEELLEIAFCEDLGTHTSKDSVKNLMSIMDLFEKGSKQVLQSLAKYLTSKDNGKYRLAARAK